MVNEFMIRDTFAVQGSEPQIRGLVLLVANKEFQEIYRKRLVETVKTEKVLMVHSLPEAFAESRRVPFSAHVIYSNVMGGTFTFAKEIRDAKGSAHPIIIVGNDSDLEERANEIGAVYLNLWDIDHIWGVLDYI